MPNLALFSNTTVFKDHVLQYAEKDALSSYHLAIILRPKIVLVKTQSWSLSSFVELRFC